MMLLFNFYLLKKYCRLVKVKGPFSIKTWKKDWNFHESGLVNTGLDQGSVQRLCYMFQIYENVN